MKVQPFLLKIKIIDLKPVSCYSTLKNVSYKLIKQKMKTVSLQNIYTQSII